MKKLICKIMGLHTKREVSDMLLAEGVKTLDGYETIKARYENLLESFKRCAEADKVEVAVLRQRVANLQTQVRNYQEQNSWYKEQMSILAGGQATERLTSEGSPSGDTNPDVPTTCAAMRRQVQSDIERLEQSKGGSTKGRSSSSHSSDTAITWAEASVPITMPPAF